MIDAAYERNNEGYLPNGYSGHSRWQPGGNGDAYSYEEDEADDRNNYDAPGSSRSAHNVAPSSSFRR